MRTAVILLDTGKLTKESLFVFDIATGELFAVLHILPSG